MKILIRKSYSIVRSIFCLILIFFTDDGQKINAALEEKMNTNTQYYLMHERMLHKGKLVKYIGHIVISDKQNICSYIAKAISENELRPMRIMPVDSPNWLIRFNEDAVMFVYDQH